MAEDPQTPPERPTEKSKPGWINDLARRSTGLPEDEIRNAENRSEKSDMSLWKLAGLGVQFALTVAVFAFMGWALDQKMGWSPWGLMSLTLVAVIGNLYLFIKEAMLADKSPGSRKK